MAKMRNENTHLEQDLQELREKKRGLYRKAFRRTAVLLGVGFILTFLASATQSGTLEAGAGLVFAAAVISMLYPAFAAGGITREQQVLEAGVEGEAEMARLLSGLPDSYCVFRDLRVPYDGKTSEVDTIVAGPTGVYVIEVKNHRGTVCGAMSEKDWVQHKVGRGGTPYQKEFYSPVKQVGTHVYRVAGLLRKNGAGVHVTGLVYFANPEADLRISGSGETAVFAENGSGAGSGYDMLNWIQKGRTVLSEAQVKQICGIISRKTE